MLQVDFAVITHQKVEDKNIQVYFRRRFQSFKMVPLRFIAENLGAEVIWDDKSQTITIKYNK